jgi:transcriptional regulator with XRE-family HTH domain
MARDDETAREPLSRRIARLRGGLGWTQQDLADRIAISRVAVSHLELGISIPSERTVALLAGVFHLEPHALVDGTSYPEAKAERLPLVTARYTEVEHQVGLLARDLEWLDRLAPGSADDTLTQQVSAQWRERITELLAVACDPHERRLLEDTRSLLGRRRRPT